MSVVEILSPFMEEMGVKNAMSVTLGAVILVSFYSPYLSEFASN